MRTENAIIMAAGMSSRFAPLSYEKPKALIEVKGEVLIERQIRQLLDAGIKDIHVITGYKAEQFEYLKKCFGIGIIYNPDYSIRNNNSSIFAARNVINNTFICSADNYFSKNPFIETSRDSYYAANYSKGYTDEWCMKENESGFISSVEIGGNDAWYMYGHSFWESAFSKAFLAILEKEYNNPVTIDKLWEEIYISHLDVLKMKIRRYPKDVIFEFDSLDELREFDISYIADTRSEIIKSICKKLQANESDIVNINTIKTGNTATGFSFDCLASRYSYDYQTMSLIKERE